MTNFYGYSVRNYPLRVRLDNTRIYADYLLQGDELLQIERLDAGGEALPVSLLALGADMDLPAGRRFAHQTYWLLHGPLSAIRAYLTEEVQETGDPNCAALLRTLPTEDAPICQLVLDHTHAGSDDALLPFVRAALPLVLADCLGLHPADIQLLLQPIQDI